MPLVGIDNIENLHSWAENIHQNQKDTRSIHTYIVHVLYLHLYINCNKIICISQLHSSFYMF